MIWLDWRNCYDDGWKGIIHEEAFRHPAKFAYGLVTRIYRHGLAEGFWKPGDLIGDPFGGVGLGGIVAAYQGLRWIGVELESEANGGSPFVELANANFEKHKRAWAVGGEPVPRIVQGDSRRFAEIVGEVCGVVTSPPYEGTNVDFESNTLKQSRTNGASMGLGKGNDCDYGAMSGQIGSERGETYWQAMHAVYGQMFLAMKPGACAAIVLKDYVKNKARVPLCDQSAALLESIGFTVFQRCRCWLVKRTETPGLFGEPIVETTERKSFFRRLAEAKGSPRIDYEEVIWCRKQSLT